MTPAGAPAVPGSPTAPVAVLPANAAIVAPVPGSGQGTSLSGRALAPTGPLAAGSVRITPYAAGLNAVEGRTDAAGRFALAADPSWPAGAPVKVVVVAGDVGLAAIAAAPATGAPASRVLLQAPDWLELSEASTIAAATSDAAFKQAAAARGDMLAVFRGYQAVLIRARSGALTLTAAERDRMLGEVARGLLPVLPPALREEAGLTFQAGLQTPGGPGPGTDTASRGSFGSDGSDDDGLPAGPDLALGLDDQPLDGQSYRPGLSVTTTVFVAEGLKSPGTIAWRPAADEAGAGSLLIADDAAGIREVPGSDAEEAFGMLQELALGASGALSTVLEYKHPISGIAADAAHVYVSQQQLGRVSELFSFGLRPFGANPPGYADGALVTSAFGGPTALAIVPAFGLAVADPGSGRVRVISPDLGVATLFGGGSSGSSTFLVGLLPESYRDVVDLENFELPAGFAILEDGDYLVADASRHHIVAIGGGVKFGSTRGWADGPAKRAQFDTPTTLAVVRKPGVFGLAVLDLGNRRVRYIDLTEQTYSVSTLLGDGRGALGLRPAAAADPDAFGEPGGLTVDGAGMLYVTDRQHGRVLAVDIQPLRED